MTLRTFFAKSTPIAAVAALLMVPTVALASNDGVVQTSPRMQTQVDAGIDEQIGAQVPLDLTLRDEADQPITLRDCIAGKPTILVPVYYRCPMLCTKVLNGLLDAMREMPQDFSAGGKFNVVTFSMDPKEHADLATLKKNTYISQYGRPNAEQGWRFLTGSKEAITELTGALGYRFEYDKVFKEYNHPSGIIILTPEGRVARYFYGIGFNDTYAVPGGTTTLRLSLIEASNGKVGSLLDKLTLLCYRFDIHDGYSLNVLRAVQLGGLITLFLVVTGVGLALRRERRARRAAQKLAIANPDPSAGGPVAAPQPHDGSPSGGTA